MEEKNTPIEVIESYAYKMGFQGFLYPRLITRDSCAFAFRMTEKMIHELIEPYSKLSEEDKERAFYTSIRAFLFDWADKGDFIALKKRITSFVEESSTVSSYVEQVFQSYESKLYYPCLCGAVSLVERLLADNDDPTVTNYNRLLTIQIEKLVEQTSNEREDRILKANLTGYIEYLVQRVPFSGHEPERVNRHWLLHGRTNRKIDLDDCLSIFILLDMLIEVKEKTEVTYT